MTAMLGGIEPVSGENITGRMQFRARLLECFYEADFQSLGRYSFISRDTIELMPIAALMSIEVSNSFSRHPQSRAAPRSRESKLMQG